MYPYQYKKCGVKCQGHKWKTGEYYKVIKLPGNMKKCLKKYRDGVILYTIIADIINRSVKQAAWP